MKQNKLVAILGIILGIAMIVCGILSYNEVILETSTYTGESSPYSSGFAIFGTDYYTYSVNNAAETKSSVNAVSYTIGSLQALIRDCFSMFMIFFGLLTILAFLIIFINNSKTEKEETAFEETVEQTEQCIKIPEESNSEPVIIPAEKTEETEE